MYVPDGERMAMVNRWAPWWLSVQDIGGGHIGYMDTEEFEALPADLQPLVRHLCPEVEDTAQDPMVERAKAAGDRAGWGFAQQEEDPASVTPRTPTCACRCLSRSSGRNRSATGARSCSRRRSMPSTPGSSDHNPFHSILGLASK